MIARFAGSVLLGLIASHAANGQASITTLIPEKSDCPKCTVVGRVVTTLGATDGPGAVSGLPAILADTRGRYWALSIDALPIVFDRDGRFVAEIGKVGQGPGEFIGPMSAMVVPGDSVVVFDGPGQRSTLIGPDLTIGRMIRTPFQIQDAIATNWPSEVIATATLRTAGGIGWPIHRISFAGPQAIDTAHFGPGDGTEVPGPGGSNMQQIAPAKAGGVWSADVGRYRLSHWSAEGKQLEVFERSPEWFTPSSRGSLGTATTPPPAGIAAIREDPGTGYLWIFIRVPAATWRDARPPRTSASPREISMRSIAMEKLFTTRIEVVNPKTGRIVAQGALNDLVLSALPDKRVATYVVDSAGIPRVNIISLRIGAR